MSLSSEPDTAGRELEWMRRELASSTELWVGGKGAALLAIGDQDLKLVAEWRQLDEAFLELAAGSVP